MSNPDADLQTLRESLAAALPLRHVQRGLIDPAMAERKQLLDGLVCLVADGGGDFANYYGREGELGRMKVAVVGFVLVAENTPPLAVELAELALLRELLAWTNQPALTQPGWAVLPQSWRCSQQMEHPYGWLVLELDVRLT